MDKKSIINQAEYLNNLDTMEKEWTEQLDKEEKMEREISEYTKLITDRLLSSSTQNTLVNIDNRKFFIGYKVMKNNKNIKVLKLAVMDIVLQELTRRKAPVPVIEVEYENQFNLKSNLAAAVEAWLRNETGTFKPEMSE